MKNLFPISFSFFPFIFLYFFLFFGMWIWMHGKLLHSRDGSLVGDLCAGAYFFFNRQDNRTLLLSSMVSSRREVHSQTDFHLPEDKANAGGWQRGGFRNSFRVKWPWPTFIRLLLWHHAMASSALWRPNHQNPHQVLRCSGNSLFGHSGPGR